MSTSVSLVSAFLLLIAALISTKAQQYVGDLCTRRSTGSQGTCTILTECPAALEELQKQQKFPQTCGFKGTQPIVCCDKSTASPQPTTASPQLTTATTSASVTKRKPGEISLQKCREYSKHYVVRHRIPTLLIGEDEYIDMAQCGHEVESLIIGGTPAKAGEFPHMVLIGYQEQPNADIRWLCGGSTISENYILTAGHCLESRDWGPARFVRLGITNINDSTYKQEFSIAERIKHPDYIPPSHYNDIGLIKLKNPIKFNPQTVPACLYSKPQLTNSKAIASGWGRTQWAGEGSNDLLKVVLDMIDQDSCNRTYVNQIGRKLKDGIVENIQVCAGSLDENSEKDTCQGDSGGPLQIYHINDDIQCMYDVMGITSFGKACSGSPGVYTRVSTYVKWIEDIVWPQ